MNRRGGGPLLSEFSEREPVDGSPLVAMELGQSGAAHADARDYGNVVLAYVCLETLLVNYNNKFKLRIDALDRAHKIEK